jgi:hypothetical protein
MRRRMQTHKSPGIDLLPSCREGLGAPMDEQRERRQRYRARHIHLGKQHLYGAPPFSLRRGTHHHLSIAAEKRQAIHQLAL